MKIQYTPIGVMHCEIRDPAEAPRFYTISDIGGVIEVYDEYAPGLQGLEQNDHIMVVFHFHLSEGQDLLQQARSGGDPVAAGATVNYRGSSTCVPRGGPTVSGFRCCSWKKLKAQIFLSKMWI